VRPPVPIRDVRPDVPDGLARAIATCLEKDRAKRYRDVAELARAIAPFGTAAGAQASIEPVSSANMGVTDTVAASVLTSTGGSALVATKPMPLSEGSDGGDTGRPTLPSRAAGVRERRWNANAAILAVAVVLALAISVASARRARPVVAGAAAIGSAAAAPAPTAQPVVTGGLSALTPSAPPALTSSPIGSSWSIAEFPADAEATTLAPPAVPIASRRSSLPAALFAARPGCDVDFDLDSQGRKHFKPECVNAQASLSPAASAKAACDPNYDLDAQGRKHFKPQCFLNASQ
jgi:hypothetical protein